jgi:hypothetical protein
MQTQWQQMEDQQREFERARQRNVELFTAMFLSLGPDCIKIANGTRHDGELAEARGLAAWRWNQLLGMEQQIVREEQRLASRPKTRPAQPGDDELPDRTLKQRDAEWQDKTKYLRDSLAALRSEAASERRLLESFTARK